MRLVTTLLLAGAAAAAGCSATLDFDSISSGAAGGQVDAGPGQGDSGTKPPTGADGAADGGYYCRSLSPAPSFCDDFDDPQPLHLWTQSDLVGGAIDVDQLASVSAPASLLSQTSAALKGSLAHAIRRVSFNDFANNPAQFRIDFDMRIDAFDSAELSQISLFGMLFGTENDYNQIVVNVDVAAGKPSLKMAENAYSADASGYQAHGGTSVQANAWVHVHIELDVLEPKGSGNLLRFSIDGKVQYDGPLIVALKGGQPRAELGIGYVKAPSAPWAIRYDNFVANVH